MRGRANTGSVFSQVDLDARSRGGQSQRKADPTTSNHECFDALRLHQLKQLGSGAAGVFARRWGDSHFWTVETLTFKNVANKA